MLLPWSALAQNPYADLSDPELSKLTNHWEILSQEERRALLTEIRMRMAAASDERPIIEIKSERRYGHTVQRADGTLIHIETREQVIHYQQTPDADGHAFGFGFERRVAETQELPAYPGPESGPADTAPIRPAAASD